MGICLPEKCLRGKDCKPLSQIESDCKGSFVCCGHNDGTTRAEKQDRFRFCVKNKEIDQCDDLDDADMKDTMSVLSQALSVDEHIQREGER